MTDKRIERIHQIMDEQCQKRGYATAVDTLMELGMLNKKDYQRWRVGQVDYLERVCSGNLNKLSDILIEMQKYAKSQGYHPSETVYKAQGKSKRKGVLQFTKYKNPTLEKRYATHYVDKKWKAEKGQANDL